MDLALTLEEMKFRSDLQSWLSEVLPDGSPRRGKNFSLNHAMIRSGGSKRFMKKVSISSWPVEYGGTGWTDTSGRFLHKNVAVPEPQCSPHLGIRWWAR